MALPTSLSSFTTPGGATDALSVPDHSVVHTEIKASLEGLEQTVGVKTSIDPATVHGKLSVVGTNFITNGACTSAQPSNPNVIDAWVIRNYMTTVVATREVATPGNEPATVLGDVTEPGDGYYAKYVTTPVSNSSSFFYLAFPIEDVKTLAGKTATFSFYAKSASSGPISVKALQYFGFPGSTTVQTALSSPVATTTSWARYSFQLAIPSVTGKTIGPGNRLIINLYLGGQGVSAVPADTYSVWGAQLEAGDTPTRFKREDPATTLAKCKKYYTVVDGGIWGAASTSSVAVFDKALTTPMVTSSPTFTMLGSDYTIWIPGAVPTPITSLTATSVDYSPFLLAKGQLFLYASGLSGLTPGVPLIWNGSSFSLDSQLASVI